MSCDTRFAAAAQAIGHAFDGEIKKGGNYTPLLRVDQQLYVSGQIPRAGDRVMVTGVPRSASTSCPRTPRSSWS